MNVMSHFHRSLVVNILRLFTFIEMAVFLLILMVGFAYVWVKGDLDWDKPKPIIPHVNRPPKLMQESYSKGVETPVTS